ncbi:MAG: DUF2802 domain-containing protein [Pseudomonadota bacterium]|jgi:cell division protein FtsB
MNLDLSALGWREALILAVVLVALYAAVALVRLLRVSKARPAGGWKQNPSQFGEQQFLRAVEAELQQLRAQVTELREEVDKLKAARTVSPHYSEAVALAQQGMDALTIADRCGIAVAEAELVRALSRETAQGEDR